MSYEYEDLRKEPLPEYAQKINAVIIDSLDRYAMSGCPTGGFLRAVLEHDLFAAFNLADDDNSLLMRDLVMYIHNRLPATCHGSPEEVDAWIKNGGIKGR